MPRRKKEVIIGKGKKRIVIELLHESDPELQKRRARNLPRLKDIFQKYPDMPFEKFGEAGTLLLKARGFRFSEGNHDRFKS